MPASKGSKRKPHLFRFSLRTLLVLITLLGIWLGLQGKRARDQKEAIQSILAPDKNNDVAVYYDYQLDDAGQYLAAAVPPGPEWLRQLIGDHFFISADSISFYGPDVSASQLEPLKRLPGLKSLTFSSTSFSDEGFAHLKDLGTLRSLVIDDSTITDGGLSHLVRLSRLQELRLFSNEITDAGLLRLARLGQLGELHVMGDGITHQGASRLANELPRCKVFLGETRIRSKPKR